MFENPSKKYHFKFLRAKRATFIFKLDKSIWIFAPKININAYHFFHGYKISFFSRDIFSDFQTLWFCYIIFYLCCIRLMAAKWRSNCRLCSDCCCRVCPLSLLILKASTTWRLCTGYTCTWCWWWWWRCWRWPRSPRWPPWWPRWWRPWWRWPRLEALEADDVDVAGDDCSVVLLQ